MSPVSTADERRASMYQGDGVLDIGVGAGLMLGGLFLLSGATTVVPVLWLLAWLLVWVGVRWVKERITAPRMRRVDFRASTEALQLHRQVMYATLFGTVALLAMGALLALVLFVLAASGLTLSGTASTVLGMAIGLILVAALAVIGWVADARRFFVYTGLAVAAGVAVLAGVPLAWALSLFGGIVLVCGLVMLITFVRRYPRAI